MSQLRSVPATGVCLVALAAALWGTDALFRRGLALEAPAVWVVFWEHLFLAVVTSPLLWRARHALLRLDRRDWLSIVLIGAGASTTATIAFTAALGAGDPTTPLLLQKVQPVVAVLAAAWLLGERISVRFGALAVPALVGVYLITFPTPTQVSIEIAWPALLGLTAAALWALGTVLGRRVSAHVPFPVLTALRFTVGLPVAGALLLAFGAGPVLPAAGQLPPLALLSLIPGLVALSVYYRGLRATPASLASVAELAFPLSAVAINRLAFGTTLSTTQWTGVVVLALAVLALNDGVPWVPGRQESRSCRPLANRHWPNRPDDPSHYGKSTLQLRGARWPPSRSPSLAARDAAAEAEPTARPSMLVTSPCSARRRAAHRHLRRCGRGVALAAPRNRHAAPIHSRRRRVNAPDQGGLALTKLSDGWPWRR